MPNTLKQKNKTKEAYRYSLLRLKHLMEMWQKVKYYDLIPYDADPYNHSPAYGWGDLYCAQRYGVREFVKEQIKAAKEQVKENRGAYRAAMWAHYAERNLT